MPPKQAVIKTKKQDTRQDPVTTMVPVQRRTASGPDVTPFRDAVRVQYQAPSPSDAPIQRKVEDYYTDSAQQIADYFIRVHEYVNDFFDTDGTAKQAALTVLSELEPYTTECEWNGTSLKDYKEAFKERFKDVCRKLGKESILTDSIIDDFWDEATFSTSFQKNYPKSAEQVYGYSYNNKYEEHRVKAKGETESPAMKKLFLRRLNPKNKMNRRDDIIDRKLRESRTEPLLDEEYPRLKMPTGDWSPIVNDAFVGGGMDAEARFKISDLSDKTTKAIANLSQEGAGSKLKQFWDICKTDLNLYDKQDVINKGYGYTVLAREIAQLLKKGWIFKTFSRKEGSKEYYPENNLNLIAFKDENAAKAYIDRKEQVRQNRESDKDQAPTGT